jgi:hypothetical protein
MSKLELATCEPYFNSFHGGKDMNGFMVIYSYSTEEFYENIWKEELTLYMKRLYAYIRRLGLTHPNILNYDIVIRHLNHLQLVEIITDDTYRDSCILHTYKINIFKKIWKKRFYNKLKSKINYSKV